MRKFTLVTTFSLMVIMTISINVMEGANDMVMNKASYFPSSDHILFGETFSDGDFNRWTIVDAPTAIAGPSDWAVVEAKGSLVLLQDSNIYTPDPPYEGTYVYAGEETWSDYYLGVNIEPDDNDGIFVIFRRVDDDNYYRFMMDRQRNYQRLEKKIGGVYSTLAEDLSTGYGNSWIHIQVAVIGNNITVTVDHEHVFSVTDSSLSNGAIGLGTWANTDTYFDNVSVTTSNIDPYADSVMDANIKTAGNSEADTWEILGQPQFNGNQDFLSIGGPSYWIVLDMGDGEEIIDGPGNDLRVYEIGFIFGGVDEEYDISVSNTPTGPWTYIGQGWTTSVFDLAGTGISSARYVRIDDLSSRTDYASTPGSDIDAIQGLNINNFVTISPPPNFNMSFDGNDVFLNWDMVNDAVAYYIYGSNRGNNTGYSLIDSVPAGTHNYTHANARDDNFYYVITAIDSIGVESDFSVEVPYYHYLPTMLKP